MKNNKMYYTSLRKSMIIFIFLFYIVTHVNGLYSIKPSNHGNKIRLHNTALYTFTEKIITLDNYKFSQNFSPLSNHIWWDLFKSPSTALSTEVSELENWIPKVNAWRSAFNIPAVVSTLSPPGSLNDYFDRSYIFCDTHAGKIKELWIIIKSQLKIVNDEIESLVVESLEVAYIALWGKQTTRSLEESINRAVGVASVLGELNADLNVIVAGILHEVIFEHRNNAVVMKQLQHKFGADLITLSKQYSLLPKFMARKTDYTLVQSENQLQMLVTLAEDYRCLYIRIADRVHALRVLPKLPLDAIDQQQIALEALKVYSPLAHKMGIMKIRDELEDLAFQVLDPEMYKATEFTQIAAHNAYQAASNTVEDIIINDEVIKSSNVQLRLTHRIKSKYQLYKKMQRKGLKSPSDVRDALGLRLIIETPKKLNESQVDYDARNVGLCYYLIERLRRMPGWEPSENGFKDYILNKKENGYQSLHQYILNIATNTNVEIQVRSKEMHIHAELGAAAHFSYKDQICRTEIYNTKHYKLAWRSTEQLNAKSSAELIGLAKKQLMDSRVYVYLDDMSTVLNLPKGSTALDAAFQIHTDMGLCTKGIRIDGQSVTLEQPLQSGDTISVQGATNNEIQTKYSWLKYATTTYAQMSIRKHLKDNHKDMLLCTGLVQLLHVLTLNHEKLPVSLVTLDAKKLNKMIELRTGKTLEKYLILLSVTMKLNENQLLLSKLTGIPVNDLIMTSSSNAITWAKNQEWENNSIQDNILIPMIQEILPSIGYSNIDQKWIDIINKNSLIISSDINDKDKSFNNYKNDNSYTTVITNDDDTLAKVESIQDQRIYRYDSSKEYNNIDEFNSKKHYLQHKILVQKPFSLQAPSLSRTLLKHAKYNYAKKALAQERKLNIYQN